MTTNYFSKEYLTEKEKQINLSGVNIKKVYAHFSYDKDVNVANDTFTIAQNLSPNTIVKSVRVNNQTITSAQSNDIMICEQGKTTAVTVAEDKINLLASSFTMATSREKEIIGTNISTFEYGKSLKDLTGLNKTFDIVLIIKAAGTTSASFDIVLELVDNL